MFQWIKDGACCFGKHASDTEVAREEVVRQDDQPLGTYRYIGDPYPIESLKTSKTQNHSFDNSIPFQGKAYSKIRPAEVSHDKNGTLSSVASTRVNDTRNTEHVDGLKSAQTSQLTSRIHEPHEIRENNLPNLIVGDEDGIQHDHIHVPGRKLQSLDWPKRRQPHLEYENPKRIDDISERYEKLQLKVSKQDMKLQQLEEKIVNEQREKEELLTRLSRYTSNQLADNNPNIADLGDMNRPTKLAEKFSELYDNEWTEAFDSLMKESDLSEESAISGILQTLKKIFDVCQSESSASIEHAVKAMSELTMQNETSEPVRRATKELKEERKRNYKAFLPELHRKVESSLSTPQSMQDLHNKAFVTKATELCWLMCIQDPPMDLCFSGHRRKKFDDKLFKPYTETGKYTDFIVWPALYLHEGGSLLSRGVAQGREGKKKKKKVSTSKDSFRSKENLFENAHQNDRENDDEHWPGDRKDSDREFDTCIVVESAEED